MCYEGLFSPLCISYLFAKKKQVIFVLCFSFSDEVAVSIRFAFLLSMFLVMATGNDSSHRCTYFRGNINISVSMHLVHATGLRVMVVVSTFIHTPTHMLADILLCNPFILFLPTFVYQGLAGLGISPILPNMSAGGF